MEKLTTKNKKEFKDDKLKDKQIEEQILKSLEGVNDGEERFKVLIQRYIDNERLHRHYQQDQRVKDKQYDIVMREKENLQKEMNKCILMREKLQDVCREQQRLIKSVKNESMQRIREEEELRKESQTKFQASLNDITKSLSKNNEENLKLRDHNIEMTNKLKFLAEQYRTREQQLEKLNEQVNLETQLHQAKLNKAQVEFAMEKEILLREKHLALEKLTKTQEALKEMGIREVALKEQLNIYTAKYDDFQQSLKKSNDIFTTYKTEMEKMSKHTKKLEKESLSWKFKWEKSNATLIELATEKQERDDHAIRCNKQVDQLQKLLRALQNERTHLYKILKENNVEVPPLPALPEEPELLKTAPINTGGNERDKMEMMSKNCAELKATLANLQDQMKFLNLKGEMAAQTKSLQQQQQQHQHQQQPQQQQDLTKKRQKRNKKSKNKSIERDDSNEGSLDQIKIDNNLPNKELDLPSLSTDESLIQSVSDEVNTEISTIDDNKDINNEIIDIIVEKLNEKIDEIHEANNDENQDANNVTENPPLETSTTVPN